MKNILIYYSVLLLFLLVIIEAQPECQTFPLPKTIPISITDSMSLDLTKYFKGNNLTLTLQPNTTSIFIKPLIEQIHYKTYDWGQALSTDWWEEDANRKITINVSILIKSNASYYLYFGNIINWNDGISKLTIGNQDTLGKCSNHIMKNDGSFAIDCTGVNKTPFLQYNLMIFGSIYNTSFNIVEQEILVKGSYFTKLVTLSNGLILRVYMTKYSDSAINNNSYIELWNPQSKELIKIYDRTILGLKELSIVDVCGGDLTNKKLGIFDLYILDYNTGVYWFKVLSSSIQQVGFWRVQFYEKMSVNLNRIVAGRRGSLTEIQSQSNIVTKYQLSADFVLDQIQSNDRYILVRSVGTLSVFRIGYPQAYSILQLYQSNKVILLDSNTFLIIQNVLNKVEPIMATINQPYLYALSVTKASELSINGVSSYYSQSVKCSQKVSLEPREVNEQGIWDNGFNTGDNENIYINRPGEAMIKLGKYGAGSNLTYSIQVVFNKLNLKYQVYHIFNATAQFLTNQDLDTSSTIYRVFSFQIIVRIEFSNRLNIYFLCKQSIDSFRFPECTEFYRKTIQTMPQIINYYQVKKDQSFFTQNYIQSEIISSNNTNILLVSEVQPTNNKVQTLCQIQYDKFTKIYKVEFIQTVDGQIGFFVLLSQKEIQHWIYSEGDNQCHQQFNINAQVLKWKLFSPLNFTLLNYRPNSQVIQLLFTQFNELTILSITLPSYYTQLSIVETVTMTLRSVPLNGNFSLQVKYPYIVISADRNILHQYLIFQNQIQFIRELPRYGKYQNRNNKPLPNSQIVGVQLLGEANRNLILYKMEQTTSLSSYFAEIPLNEEELFAFVTLSSIKEPFIIVFQKETQSQKGKFSRKCYKIYENPELKLLLTDEIHLISKEQFYVKLSNAKSSVRHIITLIVSNFPENITYGQKYPYSRLTFDVAPSIIIPMKGWFKGSVLFYQSKCFNCIKRDGAEVPLIKIKDKISLRQYISGYKGSYMIYEESEETAYILRQNLIYSINIKTHELGRSFVLPVSEQCSQLKIHRRCILVLCGRTLMGISLSSKGWWIVSNYLLPAYGSKLLFENNIATVLSNNGVYIFFVNNNLDIRLLDFISNAQVGVICSCELMTQQISVDDKVYVLVLTICDIGVSFITFTLKFPVVINYLHRQTLYLSAELSKQRFNLPSGTTFIQTLTKSQDDNFRVFTIMNKFNSFEWLLEKTGDVIVKVSLIGIINKYSSYEVIASASLKGQFLMLQQRNSYDNMFAIYDLTDVTVQEGLNYYYIMDTIPLHEKFYSTLIVSDSIKMAISLTPKSLLIFSIFNGVEVLITNSSQIYTQSLQIIASSLSYARSVELQLAGIDQFIWEWWYTLLIVLGACILAIIAAIIIKAYWARYQAAKKLIPLLVDYDEFEEEIGMQEKGRYHIEEDHNIRIQGNINQSVRQSLENN